MIFTSFLLLQGYKALFLAEYHRVRVVRCPFSRLVVITNQRVDQKDIVDINRYIISRQA